LKTKVLTADDKIMENFVFRFT